MIKPIDDAHLWRSFLKCDRKLFEILLKQYYQTMFNYGIRFVQSKDLAYDCLQDLFVELWNRRSSLETPGSINAYLINNEIEYETLIRLKRELGSRLSKRQREALSL